MGNRNYLNIGETLHLTSAIMKPTRLDVEYLYYSYMYYNNSKPNYGIGILSIFHKSQSDLISAQVVNDYDAIRFTPKNRYDANSN